jgi:hypothetical protein
MSKADQFREYAEEAMCGARQSKTEKERQALIELACTWTQAAVAVLLDAAFDTSPRDLKRYAVSVASLAVVAVNFAVAGFPFPEPAERAHFWRQPQSARAQSSVRRPQLAARQEAAWTPRHF